MDPKLRGVKASTTLVDIKNSGGPPRAAPVKFTMVADAVSAIAPIQSALHQAILVGQGGVGILAANTILSVSGKFLTIRGGAVTKTKKSKELKGKQVPKKSKESKGKEVPFLASSEGRSVLWMAAGMALHYLGYSLARSITVALFTSSSTGYAGMPGAFPFAMAFVSPVALAMLIGYGVVLERSGPRGALNKSTLFCSAVVFASSALMEIVQARKMTLFGIPAIKYITGPLFIFRESYVQLLTSQYWSFMASVLSPDQSARWFAPISGLTSIASAVGGVIVLRLAGLVGLSYALGVTGLSLLASLYATNAAYDIAEENGFAPTERKKPSKMKKQASENGHEQSLIKKATTLFKRVPVLRSLFFEILASQGLATLLNVVFVHALAASIPDDATRAGWVGNFYALINIISMVLQFGVLPFLMQLIEPKDVWRTIPLISLAFVTFQAVQQNPSLYVVSASLLVMKVLEYSARRMLDEMVYVPLDFESRFVGKEIMGVFGYRFGKSLMSLSLSGLTSAFGNFDIHQLSICCNAAALLWTKTAWSLSALVPTRKAAQEKYSEARKR